MTGPEEILVREFRKELGIPNTIAQSIVSDLTSKVRLKLANPPCPFCGGPFENRLSVGETVKCSFCSSYFTVEDSAQKVVEDILKDYENISDSFVKRIQTLFSTNVEVIMGKMEKIETTTATTLTSVLDIQANVKLILDKFNILTQLPSATREMHLTEGKTPKSEAMAAVRKFDKAIEGLRENELQNLDFDTLLRAGNIHYDNHEFKKALSYYERALAINPKNRTVWYNLGLTYDDIGEAPKALDCYKQAVRISPDYVDAWNNIGVTYARIGEHHKAIEAYEKALQIRPNYHIALANIGASLLELGEYRKAIEVTEKALQTQRDDASSWYNIGTALLHLGENRKAIKMYEKALQIRQNDASSWINMGHALSRLGEHREAIKAYEKALQIEPDDAEAWCCLAAPYEILGEHRRTIEICTRALQIDPNQATAWHIIGLAHMNSGELGKAKECLLRGYDLAWKAGDTANAKKIAGALRVLSERMRK